MKRIFEIGFTKITEGFFTLQISTLSDGVPTRVETYFLTQLEMTQLKSQVDTTLEKIPLVQKTSSNESQEI